MTIGVPPHRWRKVRSAIDAAAEGAAVLSLDGLIAAAGGQRLAVPVDVHPPLGPIPFSGRCMRRAAKWDSNTVLTHHAKF
jgi:hypothetical protein